MCFTVAPIVENVTVTPSWVQVTEGGLSPRRRSRLHAYRHGLAESGAVVDRVGQRAGAQGERSAPGERANQAVCGGHFVWLAGARTVSARLSR
jgi:hypothetical protein